tara:strand:- start:394 stop:1398 length:1005 start_codon:yes stop_codon:yes gene_type:complete
MNETNCLICNQKTDYLDEYKFNVNSDIEFFGRMQIVYCKECDLSFADPMPSASKLDHFYKYVYRDFGRPHYIELRNLEEDLLSQKNMNYIQYLSSFINFDKIENIFDFGSGSGDIGYLLSKKFKHLKLHTIETDNFSKKILKNRNFKIYENFNEIDIKFDLIISTHVIEHLTNLDIFENFKNVLKKNHHIFIEVPNNLFEVNFHKRPYDSPHLIFFSKKSLYLVEKKFNLQISDLTYSFHSIDRAFDQMKKSKLIFEGWTKKTKYKNKKILIKNFFKSILPKKILKMIRKLRSVNSLSYENFINGDKNSWCLRVIYKNIENNGDNEQRKKNIVI